MSSELSRILIGGIALFILISPFIISGGPGERIYLNGEAVGGLDVRSFDGEIRVPVEKAVRMLGGKIKRESSGVSSVKWGYGDSFYLTSFDMVEKGGVEYVGLISLAKKMNVDVRRMGDGIFLNKERADLLDLDLDSRKIKLYFDRYAPYTVTKGQNELKLRFYSVRPTSRSLSPTGLGYIDNVSISPAGKNQLVVRIKLSGPVDYYPEEVWNEEGRFSLGLSVGLAPSESTDGFFPGKEPIYRKYYSSIGGSAHSIHSLRIPDWEDNYRLQVALADGQIGERSSLISLMRQESGIAAVNGNFFDPRTGIPIGLLVRNGEILSDNWGRRGVMTVDYVGEVAFSRPQARLFLENGEREIEVTDVNRPAGTNDLIVFTGGYRGSFCSREGASKTVLVVERGKVASKLESREYIPDYFDLLVVATGSYRRSLDSVFTGESLEFKWQSDPPLASRIKTALSAGPILIQRGRDVLNLGREDFDSESSLVNSRATRSVVATTWDGELLFLVVNNSGISLRLLPELLLSSPLNIREAMALDGGSSAGFVYSSSSGVKKVGGDRRVPVGLVVVPKKR